MTFAEDLTPFFDPSGFGVEAVFQGSIYVNGILDLAYVEPLGRQTDGSAPTFTCAAADVPAVARGDDLVVNSRAYKVIRVEPDGTGVVILHLEAQ